MYINELMADNDTILEDPDEAGSYPDWIELYNPGSEAIDLGGLYLTDDLTDPTQFQIPAGVTIPAAVSCSFMPITTPTRATSTPTSNSAPMARAWALFGADGVTQIDAVTFDAQTTDIAYGRETDGTGSWAAMCEATPGSVNTNSCSADYFIYLPMVIE